MWLEQVSVGRFRQVSLGEDQRAHQLIDVLFALAVDDGILSQIGEIGSGLIEVACLQQLNELHLVQVEFQQAALLIQVTSMANAPVDGRKEISLPEVLQDHVDLFENVLLDAEQVVIVEFRLFDELIGDGHASLPVEIFADDHVD